MRPEVGNQMCVKSGDEAAAESADIKEEIEPLNSIFQTPCNNHNFRWMIVIETCTMDEEYTEEQEHFHSRFLDYL